MPNIMYNMDEKEKEILVIAQEECAEVIQEISKIFRFGITEVHKDGMLHREKLETEVGDLLCMIDLMVKHGIIDSANVASAKTEKLLKLEKWSDIFK